MNPIEDQRILVVRPGATELDQQERICGQLDVPLSDNGRLQIESVAAELEPSNAAKIYCGPSLAAKESAEILAAKLPNNPKIKIEDDLRNLDCGLWHGKSIGELKETQPKIYKLWQDNPETVFPPDGESLVQLTDRLRKLVKRLFKKTRGKTVVVVAAEPVACSLRSLIEAVELKEYWTVEPQCGTWFEIKRHAESPTVDTMLDLSLPNQVRL